MYGKRVEQLKAEIANEPLAALAIIPGPSMVYLTGLSFHLSERPVVAFFSPDQQPHLVLPELERSKAEGGSLPMALFPYGEDQESRAAAFSQALSILALERQEMGAEFESMRLLEQGLISQAAPGLRFFSAGHLTARLRSRKGAPEIAAMQRAAEIAETALAALLPSIRLGMTERQLAAELVVQLLRAGSEPHLPFGPIVASGPNSALPHAVPSDRQLEHGDFLLFDWGARYQGYVSDITRTFALGEASEQMQQIHLAVRQANRAAKEAIRPGATYAEIDQTARQVIKAAGFDQYFIHRTGHGLGLEAHEPPSVQRDNNDVLVVGTTFTVEPGIYIPGLGGVRIEDNVVVSETGYTNLTRMPRVLKVIE